MNNFQSVKYKNMTPEKAPKVKAEGVHLIATSLTLFKVIGLNLGTSKVCIEWSWPPMSTNKYIECGKVDRLTILRETSYIRFVCGISSWVRK